jgi:phosphate-selective porin OprO/OprP
MASKEQEHQPGRNMRTQKSHALLAALTIAIAMIASPCWAADILASSYQKASGSAFDDLWSHAILYQSQDNPILQEFALQGRFHVQYAVGSADQGNFTSGDLQKLGMETWGNADVRRWYMGFKSTLFHDLKLQGHAVINPDWDPVYNSIFDLYATWGVNDQLQLNTGKVEVKFTKEYEVSSKEIVTLERSLLINQLAPGQITGVWVAGRNVAGPLNYELGIYSADVQEEFTEFQAGAITLGKIGYDLKSATGLEKAGVGLHWMRSTQPGVADAKKYDDNLALTGEIKQGRWAATSDLVYASGKNDLTGADVPDVWGISIIPTYNFTEKLQLVTRYQLARSDQNNGITLQNRYDRLASDLISQSGKAIAGNQYQAGYLGLNYYLYSQKLKLMTGVEYATMQDAASDGGEYNGWTWTTGLRLFF